MVALSPNLKLPLHGHIGSALLIVYQIGLVATACILLLDHLGRCAAVFNCMVLVAADLFRAMMWPLYWLVQVLAPVFA